MPRSKPPRKRAAKVQLTPLGQRIERLISKPRRKVYKETGSMNAYAGRRPMIPQ